MKKRDHIFTQDDGYFTLEATLIFPLIMLATFFMMFILIWFYQTMSFQQQSALAVEQAAHHWANSHTDVSDGRLAPGHYDSLYWRTFDQLISLTFGLNDHPKDENHHWQVENDVVEDDSLASLSAKKLARSEFSLGSIQGSGSLAFQHRILEKRIHAEADRRGLNLQLPYFSLPREVRTMSTARVSEPVEFTRNLELLRFYVERLRKRFVSKEQQAEAFQRFTEIISQDVFFAHDHEADDYLRELVNGRQVIMSTSYGNRTIDAWDQDQVAHQAFLTTNTTNLREVQIPKDEELLNTGQVRGVIWHFFKHANPNIRTGPPNSIRELLKERGIVVVIHD